MDLARRSGLRALAITDHDTLEGYDQARPYAEAQGLELVCGIELSTRLHGKTAHILGYFLDEPPGEEFRDHLECVQKARRERNERLTKRLRELGLDVALEEAELLGRSQTGRPHFAQVLVQKGYVATYRDAFDRYLDESAAGYVERRDPTVDNVLRWIREANGISSWAHPGRYIRESGQPAKVPLRELASKGMNAVEVYHPDHSPSEEAGLRSTAKRLGLAVTGGSDYHGPDKSTTRLGGLHLPLSLLRDLKSYRRATVADA